MLSRPGIRLALRSRPHLGKEDLKSGKEVTPGQSSSVGVPRRLGGGSVWFMGIARELNG